MSAQFRRGELGGKPTRPDDVLVVKRAKSDDTGAGRDEAREPMPPVVAVARRLGVAPATLRTWDRRYGLGPRRHASGRHRRYDDRDIARLELMQRALLRGVAPAQSARYALTRDAMPDRARDVLPDVLSDSLPDVPTDSPSDSRTESRSEPRSEPVPNDPAVSVSGS